MPLLLLLASPALAEGLVAGDMAPCASLMVADIVPPAGAVDVPVDVVPSVTFWDGGCAVDGTLSFELTRLDGDAEIPVHSETLEVFADPPTLWLPSGLDQELEPNADYLMRVTPDDGFGEPVIVSFSTGEGLAGAPTEAPEVSHLEASWGRDRGSRWSNLFATAEAAEDPHDLAVLLIRDADDPERIFGAGYAPRISPEVMASASLGGERAEVCVEAVQIDARAQEVQVSEVVCAAPQRRGCSVVGGVGGWMLALSGLLGALRRRR